MKNEELFVGFDPEQQARHEQYLVDRFGDDMRESIAQSQARVRDWKKSDWEKSGAAFNQICADLIDAMRSQAPADGALAQSVVRRHFEWLKQFWTPTRESYIGHTLLITDWELRKAYEAHHAELPEFIAAGIKVFAENELA